jgi:hypothetical protein
LSQNRARFIERNSAPVRFGECRWPQLLAPSEREWVAGLDPEALERALEGVAALR